MTLPKHLLAQSSHQKNPIKIYDTGYHLQVEIPSRHVKVDTEQLENGRTLNIARCSFFDDHLGVSPHGNKKESLAALRSVVENLLNRLAKKNELCDYLRQKKFSFSDLGNASLASFQKPVSLSLNDVLSVDNTRSLR